MKQIRPFFITILFVLLFVVACSPAVGEGENSPTTGTVDQNDANLPLIPAPQGSNLAFGEPLPGGENDPFANATFTLDVTLPAGPQTAVVQAHTYDAIGEAEARELANQLGFTGPLYVQEVSPEFLPQDADVLPVYTLFDGQRWLTINGSSIIYENRGLTIDYDNPPAFDLAAAEAEAQFNQWGVLSFPYEISESEGGFAGVHRLIDGIASEHVVIGFSQSETGEFGSFNFSPSLEAEALGNYPLITAEAAWEQLQTAEGRSGSKYELIPAAAFGPAAEPFAGPQMWVFPTEPGQLLQLYQTPTVFRPVGGGEPVIFFGDLRLAAEADKVAEIATHLADVLHLWGTAGVDGETKTFVLEGFNVVENVQYETFEGTISREGEQVLLNTVNDETFILFDVPQDLSDGTAVYLNSQARRDAGEYATLDWSTITEKIEWPEAPPVPAEEQPTAIANVTIKKVELVYYDLSMPVDTPNVLSESIFEPVWKFTGETDNGQLATFWISAVQPQYLQLQ